MCVGNFCFISDTFASKILYYISLNMTQRSIQPPVGNEAPWVLCWGANVSCNNHPFPQMPLYLFTSLCIILLGIDKWQWNSVHFEFDQTVVGIQPVIADWPYVQNWLTIWPLGIYEMKPYMSDSIANPSNCICGNEFIHILPLSKTFLLVQR